MEQKKGAESLENNGNFDEDIDEQDTLIAALEKIMSAFGGDEKNKKARKGATDKKVKKNKERK
ncbi:hypothetical protein LJC12_05910 [Odoribacter sp. OttesenSCG-928-J03]|nr:hypothetical protein [Odoribacter sp. OttesenSCG-928-J03]MDL2283172.1 hypothetical protein [Odoribacter sp. OttesenSCG-928-G04]